MNPQEEAYVPLDPRFYPEFQYQSQGVLIDALQKRGAQQRLDKEMQTVIEKYEQFKIPYFVNYLHIANDRAIGTATGIASPITYDTNKLNLFRAVLTKLGFSELSEFDNLTIKLLRSTEFSFEYSNFALRLNRHIEANLRASLYSWIGEVGTRYRKELPLFLYYLWDTQTFVDNVGFSSRQQVQRGAPLVRTQLLEAARTKCDEIYADITISRFQRTLESFNPQDYISIYDIDAMDGFQFESFLAKLFSSLGYEVEETKPTQDQGADLFATRFGAKVVVQAKNYKDNVGNAAVQQAISAMSYFDCQDAMVVTNSYFTRSAIELAEKARVKLVDRDELQKLIDSYNQSIIGALNEATRPILPNPSESINPDF